MHNSLEAAQLCALAADSKKAFDILILDLRRLTYITDYFVICSASNITQVSAIADGIGQALAQAGVHPSHVEGGLEASWVLMDYGDVVVHIFDQQTRTYYSLEKLWSDAPRIPVAAAQRTLQGISS
ncbi:MAG: ribosome silencing factor [Nitrospiraceae bacterium]|nr:ribosome silencing factor [Nitrospiraceae bacterium]